MDSLEEVIQFTIEQAKYYLEEEASFYPFGSIKHHDGKLQPVSATTGEDYPSPEELISILEESIVERVKTNQLKAGAIGVDVMVCLPNFEEKVSAIQVKAINHEGVRLNCFLPYTLLSNKPFYRDVINEEGTLTF